MRGDEVFRAADHLLHKFAVFNGEYTEGFGISPLVKVQIVLRIEQCSEIQSISVIHGNDLHTHALRKEHSIRKASVALCQIKEIRQVQRIQQHALSIFPCIQLRCDIGAALYIFCKAERHQLLRSVTVEIVGDGIRQTLRRTGHACFGYSEIILLLYRVNLFQASQERKIIDSTLRSGLLLCFQKRFKRITIPGTTGSGILQNERRIRRINLCIMVHIGSGLFLCCQTKVFTGAGICSSDQHFRRIPCIHSAVTADIAERITHT